MARKQFETIVASAPREALKLEENTFTDVTIAAGSFVNFDFYTPSGSVGLLEKQYVRTSASPQSLGATSGKHNVLFTTTNVNGSFVYGENAYTDYIYFNRWTFGNSPSLLQPNDAAAIIAAMRGAFFDDTVGLRVGYYNNTDADLTLNITWNFTWIQRDLA